MAQKTYYIGLGITFHDPALAIVDETGHPLFAEASERYLPVSYTHLTLPTN